MRRLVAAGVVAIVVAASSGMTALVGPAGAQAEVAPTATPSPREVLPAGPDRFVDAAYRDLLGRASDPAGRRFWVDRLASGVTRTRVTFEMAHSTEWTRRVVRSTFVEVIGREPTTAERDEWVEDLRLRRRMVADLMAFLYGSRAFYALTGSTPSGWVDGLFERVVFRAPTVAERNAVLGRLATTTREVEARRSVVTVEANGFRVDELYRGLLGRPAEPDGRAFWARRLVTGDDLELAAQLAGSAEYRSRAQARMIAITAGGTHTCGLLSGGTARCWGANLNAQLGDGTTTDRSTPVTVVGLTGAVDLTAGLAHTCALITGGTVRCWGDNESGQMGDGTTTDRSTPVAVTGLTDAVALAAGEFHTCALIADGTVRCWGYGPYGQLGDGSTTDRLTPVAVTGLTGVVAITASGYHTCALVSGGTARCWGWNPYGQVGDGSTTNRLTPRTVTGLTGAVAITAGGAHTCALVTGGTVRCWGANQKGELGDGTTTTRSTPAPVVGLIGAVALTAGGGGGHTCAVITGGTVRCWGRNSSGQLGDGSTTDRSTPVTVVGLTGAIALAAGYLHTCAQTTGGNVRCWGHNEDGRVGDGTVTSRLTPVKVVGT